MTILVTGGAGFIGSNYIIQHFNTCSEELVNVDKLSYAGNLNNLNEISGNYNYLFYHLDIAEQTKLSDILDKHQPRAIINFAAETHVDNSINRPQSFVSNNINSILSLLNTSLDYYNKLNSEDQNQFRLIQISTDEVYGSLEINDTSFTEKTQYAPNSPYAASKASADHLVRAWHMTYGLPTITSNCSNNYGPRQFPEKLIPVVISQALSGNDIPLYGDGLNIRDWLYVDDHCDAINELLKYGTCGESYNIGGHTEKTNITVVTTICKILDDLRPLAANRSYCDQIKLVEDRRGHDRRYSINNHKITNATDWRPKTDFNTGIHATIEWYLSNAEWLQANTNTIHADHHETESITQLRSMNHG